MTNLGKLLVLVLLQLFAFKVVLPLTFAKVATEKTTFISLDDTQGSEESEENNEASSELEFSDDFFQEQASRSISILHTCTENNAIIQYYESDYPDEFYLQFLKPPCKN